MALSKLAVRRLTKLADYMESLPRWADDHFSMAWWMTAPKRPTAAVGLSELKRCGTSACAAGWASTMPYFKKLGLAFDGRGNLADDIMMPVSHRLACVFDADRHSITDLFFSGDDKTPKQWAKRARAFIKANA